jgi:Tat protein translocase TatB subunit
MFDLGMQELIVIFIVALLVFGPKRLPELGRTLGKAISELKRSMHSVKEQLDTELDEIKEPLSFESDKRTSENTKSEDQLSDSIPKKENNGEEEKLVR